MPSVWKYVCMSSVQSLLGQQYYELRHDEGVASFTAFTWKVSLSYGFDSFCWNCRLKDQAIVGI